MEGQAQDVSLPHSRTEFITAFGKIWSGMPEKEVLEILGKPDDIRTQFDPGGIGQGHTKEIWCYGTDRHLGFPTIGCVYIDEDGHSQETHGGEGLPPPTGMFTENELRRLLRLLNTAPAIDGGSYNPLAIIQIVNTLQPLGKEKALAVIGEYFRVCGESSVFFGPHGGILFVLRVLFDLPDNIDPDQAADLGAPTPPEPADHHRIPRFPIALVDDIPLDLVEGYNYEGPLSSSDNDVLEFFRTHGQLRSTPLLPTNDPLATLTDLMNSRQWIYNKPLLQELKDLFSSGTGKTENDENEKAMIREQVLQLINSVYRLSTNAEDNHLPFGKLAEPVWQKIASDVSALKIKWDPQQNMYVFQNGTHLPELRKMIYSRQIWKLPGLKLEDPQLVLERTDNAWVNATLNYIQHSETSFQPAILYLFDKKDDAKPLATFSFVNYFGNTNSTHGIAMGGDSSIIGLPTGSEVFAELIMPGVSTNLSPVLKP